MMRLLDVNSVPPCDNLERYYRYTDPDTGFTITARDHYNWIEQAKLHRRSNGLPIPINFEALCETQLCEQLPPGWCDRAPEAGWVNTRFSWQDIADGMRAFAALLKGGFNFVDQAEADRRSKICATCYLNQPVPGCGTCHKLAELVTGEVSNRHSEWDDRLQACAICHCPNKVQIHYPMEALDTTDSPEKQALYPSFCWKKK